MAASVRKKKARGTARVAFVAHMATISAELDQGHTVLSVYEHHQAKLGQAISYPQFVRYVRLLRNDGVVKPVLGQSPPRQPSPVKPSTPSPPIEPKPQPAAQSAPEGPPAHARHEPAPTRRTFNHDGVERPDDRRRLLGED